MTFITFPRRYRQGISEGTGNFFADTDIAAGKFHKHIGTGDAGEDPVAVSFPELFRHQIRGNNGRSLF